LWTFGSYPLTVLLLKYERGVNLQRVMMANIRKKVKYQKEREENFEKG